MSANAQKEMLDNVEKVVEAYSQFLSSVEIEAFHDVSRLPYPKDEIARSLLLLVKAAEEGQKDRFLVALMYLTQFQEGVGAKPVGKPAAEKFEALKQAADKEFQSYLLKLMDASKEKAAG